MRPVRTAATAILLLAAGGLLQLAGAPRPLWAGCYVACGCIGGWGPARAGFAALRERRLDVDLLMVVAAAGAVTVGQVFDAGLLVVIFATSSALEAVAGQRTADSVRTLLDLAPSQVTRLRPDGHDEAVEHAALVAGDLILVRPGERIGADGQVVHGASDVDQATITGEPLAVARTVGDDVFAGTLNRSGALEVQVTRSGADTVMARIVDMVDRARSTKAPTQLLVEKVERRYSLGVVAATLALFTAPLLAGAPVEPTLLRAITFMIVASPCAIVLATMPPLLAAIAHAARHGVLVKSAVAMERTAAVTRVAFDKTGTLTEGAPRVVAVHPLPGAPWSGDDVLRYAAAAERASEHPLASAIVAHAHARGLDPSVATQSSALPGRGVTATVAGTVVAVGHADVLGPRGTPSAGSTPIDQIGRLVTAAETAGRTAVIVAIDGEPAGVVEIADRPRRGAAQAVEHVSALTAGPPVLLTGDNPWAAADLATHVALSDVRAGLLPEDKLAAVTDLQAAGERLMVVGDGINDGPALAAAHVGVAMGGIGSDLAIETADVVIVRDQLDTIPALITLARRARRVVRQNLAIAATFITILVTWDIAGQLPLPLGVAGHEGSTILVALNGLRLLRGATWQQDGVAPPPGSSQGPARQSAQRRSVAAEG